MSSTQTHRWVPCAGGGILLSIALIFLSSFNRLNLMPETVKKTYPEIATANNVAIVPPYPWQWIHPWKTGTSFANALYMLGCPEDSPNNWTEDILEMRSLRPGLGIQRPSLMCTQRWGNGPGYANFPRYTRPLRENWWIGDHAYRNFSLRDDQIFITLREPIDRIISQFFYQMRITNIHTDLEMARTILQHKYLQTPLLGMHMTSLLLPPEEKIDNAATDKACKIVQNAAWVGFADDYERSICLLHDRFEFPHHPHEKKNSRPTASRNKAINTTAVGLLVRSQATILDDVVYECARERFLQELKESPNCS